MKIIEDNHGNINSIFILMLLIPIFLLLIFTINESSFISNNSITDISSDKLSYKTDDFINNIDVLTRQSLSNISYNACIMGRVSSNASSDIKTLVESSLDLVVHDYYNEGIMIDYSIIDIMPSENPFEVDVYYSVNSSLVNTSIKTHSRDILHVSIVDDDYPVYDPFIAFRKDLVNKSIYSNIDDLHVIHKCPYEEYTSHGHNNNSVLVNCLSNHYYHFSHDGLCILCRLENKSTCSHNGIETFILPTAYMNESAVSVDHVLFNITGNYNNQYNGSIFFVNNSTFLYLDNGHRQKYGL